MRVVDGSDGPRFVRAVPAPAPAPTPAAASPQPPAQDDGPCVHAALPGTCAFVGCAHYRPDGPRDEKWAFRPGTTEEDIAKAIAENSEVHKNRPGCASPIHLVVEHHRSRRTGTPDAWAYEGRGPGER